MDLGRRDHTRWLGSSGRYSTRLTLPTTNLLAAYDARVGVTNVSGACSAWADQSGNGWNASQGTAGSRPTITTTGGFASLLFDGTSDWMLIPSISAAAGPRTVYAVENKVTATGLQFLFDTSTGRWAVGTGATNYSAFDGAFRSSGTAQTSGLCRLTYQHVGTAFNFWKNGVAGSANPATIGAQKAIGGTSVIGANYLGSGERLNGHLLFLAIYNAARNTAVEAYITQEWGV